MIPGERYVVLGLGPARSAWFSDLARLATAGGVPIEFLKSVSAEETRVRLTSGRSFSALLVDGGLPSVDRDLLDDARRSGVAVFVVADPRVMRDWDALGATAVLPRDFSVEDLHHRARRHDKGDPPRRRRRSDRREPGSGVGR